MVSGTPSHCWETSETRCLLFDGEIVRGQLLSELSLLAVAVGDNTRHTAVPPEPFTLRLIMHFMEVASRYPMVGTLLLDCPRRLDEVMEEELMHWLREESALIFFSGERNDASQSLCHHAFSGNPAPTDVALGSDSGCPICMWIGQWPHGFWEAVEKGTVKILVRCALSAFPSCLPPHTRRSPFQRPRDAAIGAGQWIHVNGYVTAVFFLHREFAYPAPVLEFQPLLSNCNGMIGQSPLLLDLSLLPVAEARAVAVVGERIQVVGLLELACSNMGTVLYSRRRHTAAAATSFSSSLFPSSGQILIEARAVRTANFASHWSKDPLTATTTSTSSPFFPQEVNGVFSVNEEWEAAAFLQARCSWETVAGAAAFALAKGTGGILQKQKPNGPCRMEALLAASGAFALPTALWAVVGIALTSATANVGSIVASVVGPSDSLSVLQTFLLELAAETNMVVPLVHGLEGALLPAYTSVAASQVNIPIPVEVGRRIECVRGGLLNMAHQRVLFAPSLHTLTTSALHAVQGVLKQNEHVVVREGGQRVGCRAAGAFIGITQESMLVQDRQLFCFMERGDVVLHLPTNTTSCSVEDDHVAILELLLNNVEWGERSEMVAIDHINRCKSQWLMCCEWALHPFVDEPSVPQITTACAALLRSFFFTAKANCAEAVDAGMMTALAKLTCAHALLRQRAHHGGTCGNIQKTASSACVCGVKMREHSESTALVDAVVAIALCDASLKFIADVSLMGKSFTFDLMVIDTQFDVLHFSKELYAHLLSHMPTPPM
ncbi:hypothetical protein C3747_60g178 [Trypanosoma cruzi]|uniref:Uncharacterized protein n=2 Tax=Trypanosoma cruzi TaxID=5693 RepID=Q4DBN4_TRYCC|nr:hypothetical protein, conserved [Trypanosoma cruzi]EAN89933.1 hypothetical protein, conserved [Trypanosoma cruzi]PWV11297.1 hypothetical protein C3747_60g178 [Trypanosoma cruzi]RNC47238.1 hypothetical protein TcCL_NonESM02844 [Trypanosoma cruzi]|eukprot:XP_811784.1 hypothetical protein [Trypanosoma cruzi strain CL Brener]